MWMNPGFRATPKVSQSDFINLSNLSFVYLGQWVIVNSSCRHAFEANGGTGKENRTALICVSAGGQVLCPFLLYAGKNLMTTWCKGGPDGTHFGVTKKVSCRRELFPVILRNFYVFLGMD